VFENFDVKVKCCQAVPIGVDVGIGTANDPLGVEFATSPRNRFIAADARASKERVNVRPAKSSRLASSRNSIPKRSFCTDVRDARTAVLVPLIETDDCDLVPSLPAIHRAEFVRGLTA
jgi:hypothetical protein